MRAGPTGTKLAAARYGSAGGCVRAQSINASIVRCCLWILQDRGINLEGRLLISDRAHLLFDLHKEIDGAREAELAGTGKQVGGGVELARTGKQMVGG